MPPTDDSALLRAYCDNHSNEAFAELVTRHINLVYSVAVRHVGNPHQAEEITQAVFIVLAKKARTLRHDKALSSWLFQATHLTANNFVRSEMRRQRREQEAYMQSTFDQPETDVWTRISPLLDTAVAKLNERDRRAIVLRFYEGRDLGEVGVALGANEAAARKRVSRALEKLRNMFAKRGVNSTTETLAGAISVHSVQAAPAALAKVVAAAALGKGTTASLSAAMLAKTTLVAMKTKAIIITATAVIITAGISTWLAAFHGPSAAASPAPEDRVPVIFANTDFQDPAENPSLSAQMGGDVQSETYLNEIDGDVRRTTNSAPAIHLKSLKEINVDNPRTWYLTAMMGADHLQVVRFAAYNVGKNSSLLGKRIRVGGWMKVTNVQQWAGGTLIVANSEHGFIFDDTTSRPARGTADWQPMEFITDVPREPCVVYLALKLYGNGEAWFDDFKIDLAPPDAAITDDRDWRFFGPRPYDYTEITDYHVTHAGHPTTCVAYTAGGPPPPAATMYWGKALRAPAADRYKGHTVRMTFWMKTENIQGGITPAFHPRDSQGKIIAREPANARIAGTTDWTQHVVTCHFPDQTDMINAGFNFSGSGKFWVDTDSIRFDIVK